MAIFGPEPTFFEILISYVYNYVILATIISMLFVYYLFRTKAPLKEPEETSEKEAPEREVQSEESERKKNGAISKAIVANGDVDLSKGDHELLETILDGMNLADAVVAEDEAEERIEIQKVARERRATENEEEEENGELPTRRRQVIREVTVRKIYLPHDANYADVENTARRLIGDNQTPARKDSGTGGVDFHTAIRNIRQASKRLEDDDLSPVRNGRTM